MSKIARGLFPFFVAALMTTGLCVAQSAPNQMPQPPQSASHGKCGQTPKGCHKNQTKPPQSNPNRKCGQTPKGCHKNQPKPPSGTPPQ